MIILKLLLLFVITIYSTRNLILNIRTKESTGITFLLSLSISFCEFLTNSIGFGIMWLGITTCWFLIYRNEE